MTQLARWISILGHPFVMTAILVGTFAGRNRVLARHRPGELFVGVALGIAVGIALVRL